MEQVVHCDVAVVRRDVTVAVVRVCIVRRDVIVAAAVGELDYIVRRDVVVVAAVGEPASTSDGRTKIP
jgi:hypothetical protein